MPYPPSPLHFYPPPRQGVHHPRAPEHHAVHDGEVLLSIGASLERELGFCEADGEHPAYGGKCQ